MTTPKDLAYEEMLADRPCTCHPDDKPPVPCAKQYALTDCRRAATAYAKGKEARG